MSIGIDVYLITVDHEESVEEAIRRCLFYWSSILFTSQNFPTKRTGSERIKIELVCFNQYISNIDIIEAIKKLNSMNLRPAELRELLAFGKKHPNVQLESPIFGLGSVWYELPGYPYGVVPCLDSQDGERFLTLMSLTNLPKNYYFAVISKR